MKNFATDKGFDLGKIKSNFEKIEGGAYKEFEVQARGNDIIYVTIVTETGKIISNGTPKAANRNIVIMEDLEYRYGINDPKRPFAVEKID